MKTILGYAFIMFCTVASAQAPSYFTFQGIAMDENNELIANGTITLRSTILKSNPSGIQVYQETHAVTSTAFGHFRILIGNGNNPTTDFEEIKWEIDRHFIQIEMDIDGGEYYIHFTTTELLSVPFSLASTMALDGTQGPTGAEGIEGPQGAQGPQGPQGAPGQIGPIGPICPTGSTGPEGPAGSTGPTGPAGLTGPPGVDGLPGETGDTGAVGPPGIIGQMGPQGPFGIPGEKGETGDIGPSGPAGPAGAQGPIGPQGTTEGDPGPAGLSGSVGAPGQNSYGAAGPVGENGIFSMAMTSIVPTDLSQYKIYLDDGTNRSDGKKGFRYFNGTNWIDLY